MKNEFSALNGLYVGGAALAFSIAAASVGYPEATAIGLSTATLSGGYSALRFGNALTKDHKRKMDSIWDTIGISALIATGIFATLAAGGWLDHLLLEAYAGPLAAGSFVDRAAGLVHGLSWVDTGVAAVGAGLTVTSLIKATLKP